MIAETPRTASREPLAYLPHPLPNELAAAGLLGEWSNTSGWAKWVWQITPKMKIGEPTSKPSRSLCHRGKSCGVV